MDLIQTLKSINDTYVVKRTLNFDAINITIGLQTLSALEEVKVLESCKDLEGSQYLQTLKRNSLAYAIRNINGIDLADEITSEDGSKQTRFMFLCSYLDEWPAPIRDILFDVFTDMNLELEKKVSDTAKFTRYTIANPDLKEAKPMFRRINEPEEPADETEALKKQVDAEIASENAKLKG